MNRTVAFIKCRPLDADAWPIAQQYTIAFVGYPVWVNESTIFDQESSFKNELVDISNEEWRNLIPSSYKRGYKQQIAANANLIKQIGKSSYIMVPRPINGKCHIGKVSGGFELVDKPAWGMDYLKLRQTQGLESDYGKITDIVQVFPIEEWRSVPFTLVPAWIRYRLLSRNTAGIINNLPNNLGNSYETVKLLFESAISNNFKFLMDNQTTESRLYTWIGPNRFEHLVLDLLQLESRNSEIWHHVGGSGDGGVDGLAINDDGNILGGLQCKWLHEGDIKTIEQQLMQSAYENNWRQVVIAVLHGIQNYNPMNPEIVDFWNMQKIAQLVEKHKKNLPCAKELGLWQD